MPAVISRKDGEASFLDPLQNALQGLLDPQAQLACSLDAGAPINSSACYRNGVIYVGTDAGLLALTL